MCSISRVTSVSTNTVNKLLIDAGTACANFHDGTMRNVKASNIQCDEIWSFCDAKARNVPDAKAAPEGAGDVWTWTAIDSDSKLILSWMAGVRRHEAEQLVESIRRTAKGIQSAVSHY